MDLHPVLRAQILINNNFTRETTFSFSFFFFISQSKILSVLTSDQWPMTTEPVK